MAGRLLSMASLAVKRINGTAKFSYQKAHVSDTRGVIGKREVVGFGYNGDPNYADRSDFPMPALRWKEPTADILVR